MFDNNLQDGMKFIYEWSPAHPAGVVARHQVNVLGLDPSDWPQVRHMIMDNYKVENVSPLAHLQEQMCNDKQLANVFNRRVVITSVRFLGPRREVIHGSEPINVTSLLGQDQIDFQRMLKMFEPLPTNYMHQHEVVLRDTHTPLKIADDRCRNLSGRISILWSNMGDGKTHAIMWYLTLCARGDKDCAWLHPQNPSSLQKNVALIIVPLRSLYRQTKRQLVSFN